MNTFCHAQTKETVSSRVKQCHARTLITLLRHEKPSPFVDENLQTLPVSVFSARKSPGATLLVLSPPRNEVGRREDQQKHLDSVGGKRAFEKARKGRSLEGGGKRNVQKTQSPSANKAGRKGKHREEVSGSSLGLLRRKILSISSHERGPTCQINERM